MWNPYFHELHSHSTITEFRIKPECGNPCVQDKVIPAPALEFRMQCVHQYTTDSTSLMVFRDSHLADFHGRFLLRNSNHAGDEAAILIQSAEVQLILLTVHVRLTQSKSEWNPQHDIAQ